MNKNMVAVELVKIARELEAGSYYDWEAKDKEKTEKAINEFLGYIKTLERDIERAKKELKKGEVNLYASHLAHTLAGNEVYSESWYERLFR